jgi:DNA mismatch repair protein MutS
MADKKVTPLMQQYFQIKDEHPDTMLLFQVGDFYELFFDDARTAAAFLGITLTKRGKHKGEPVALCGVPSHALDYYLIKLVKGGFRVALCQQLERAQAGIVVKRGVTQVFTPGTLTDAKLLDDKSASYLVTFFPVNNAWGVVFAELMTAQLHATVIPAGDRRSLEAELARFNPDEVIVPNIKEGQKFQTYFKNLGYCTAMNHAVSEAAMSSSAQAWMEAQFKKELVSVISQSEAINAALHSFHAYIERTQADALTQFSTVNVYRPDDFLMLDGATQRNLELVKNSIDGGRKQTLFSVLDGAMSAMGSRMIKKWLVRPLMKRKAIEQRLDVVEFLVQEVLVRGRLEALLRMCGDAERVIGRIALQRAKLNDYLMLAQVLDTLPQIKQFMNTSSSALARLLVAKIGEFGPLKKLVQAAINDDSTQEWKIKKGFDAQLDELRELAMQSGQKILELEARERAKTGIPSLKMRYNNVHGYYVEVTKAHFAAVPDYYVRKQTLVGRERYMFEELSLLEVAISQAKRRVNDVEAQVYERVQKEVFESVGALRSTVQAVAYCDALVGFARIAADNGYARPELHDDAELTITDGRHPVVERVSEARFVPNNTNLSADESFWIITGPNMGGKSTYLRQVALTSIMAQCGSFVPATATKLPIIDRIFTRIGAGDNLAQGKSTFLVEMEETATICHQSTKDSLVILDEVGRGTSTFDGLAIAQAVVEFLHDKVGVKCLFATHYHGLAQFAQERDGMAAYHLTSKRTRNGIVFLHKVARGAADGSFGIEVAKLAGLPDSVVSRARQLERAMPQETFGNMPESVQEVIHDHNSNVQPALGVARRLRETDADDLSPRQALDLVWELRAELERSAD